MEEKKKFIKDASDALLLRVGIESIEKSKGAEELRSLSLVDLAKESLILEGEKNVSRLSKDTVLSMVTSRDYSPNAIFPSILDNVIKKSFKEGYKKASVTFDKWVKKGTLSDFKKNNNSSIYCPVGEFLEVKENGVLEKENVSNETSATRQLKTYESQFTLTRQAFIDNDVSSITSSPAEWAGRAKNTQNKQVYEILCKNPEIYDGKKLFCKEHNNLMAKGTGVTTEAFNGMLITMQLQKNQFNESTMIEPGTVVCPIGYRNKFPEMFNTPTTRAEGNTQEVSPLYGYRNNIEIVEDAVINGLCKGKNGGAIPWWLIGSKNSTDFIQIDYYNGQETPILELHKKSGTLGFVWDAHLDWGISVIDYRGAIKNPGIKMVDPLI